MKALFKPYRITLVLLFVSLCAIIFFIPKPPLLAGVSYSTAIFDQHQQLLRLTLSHDDKYRLYTPLAAIDPQIIQATLLQEDQYFYQHPGFNPLAMLKAAWQTYVVRSRRQGASTITMQLARIRFQIHSKHFWGKTVQILRAIQLERHYSKRQILEAYLNVAPYGSNIEGVGAASLIYFNKPAKQLTLAQSLSLSVIPQNPNQRSCNPICQNNGRSSLKTIRNQLFTRWLIQHPEDKHLDASMNLPLVMHSIQELPFHAPHFVNSILKTPFLQQKSIVTTLDKSLQQILERISNQYLTRKKSLGVNNAALLLVDTRNMAIKGLVGSSHFFNQQISGQINGVEIKRSPGSTLKPFVYALALDQGLIHPATVLKDVPHRFGNYNPENFDYDFMGPVQAKDALILSRNIPAIDLANQLKNPNLHQLLTEANVSQLKPARYYGLTLTLGGAELTMKELLSLYAMLANEGIWQNFRQLENEKINTRKRLLSPEASYLVLDMLQQTPLNASLRPTDSLPIAWKTGTSSGYRDAWTVGIVGPYVLGVWVGHFNNNSNPALVGKDMAAPLFFELVAAINQEYGPLDAVKKYPNSMNLKQVAVCKASGLMPTRYCQDTVMTWFISGKSPIKTDTIYREVAINDQTGLRTCHFNESTRFEIFEFWSSDLLKIFKQAGIQRHTPPPFEAGCELSNSQGLNPQITSPHRELSYIVRNNGVEPTKIPFTAITDAGVKNLYWFINDSFLSKTKSDQPYFWTAKPGRYIVRVIDDHGLSSAQDLMVRMAG